LRTAARGQMRQESSNLAPRMRNPPVQRPSALGAWAQSNKASVEQQGAPLSLVLGRI